MKTILLSGAISLVIALLGTRPVITVLRKRKLGQQVRTDGVQSHLATKSGTPTMGGIVIIIATLLGYLGGHLFTGDPMTASGLLVLFLMTGLGLVGFADDYIKLFMRRSLGLRSSAKLLGQAAVGVIFAHLRAALPRRLRPHPGLDAHLVPGRLRRLHRPGPVRDLGAADGDRHLQRGEPHRRPGRPRLRRVDPGAGRLRDHRELAVPQRLHHRRWPRTATTSATRWTRRWSRRR